MSSACVVHQRKNKNNLWQHLSSNPSPLKSPYLSTTSELCVVVGSIVLRAPTAVQSKQYSSLRCVIALAQHTASAECRTMFEVTHAIVCHAMFCRHMPTVDTWFQATPCATCTSPPLLRCVTFMVLHIAALSHLKIVSWLLVNSSRGGILFRSQWWKLFSTEILVYWWH